MQKQSDGKYHPVFYFSKITTELESKYHSFKLDTLSVVNSLESQYLQGLEFKIITDCDTFR